MKNNIEFSTEEKNNKQYFNYKKVFFFILGATIFTILISIGVPYILEINFLELSSYFQTSNKIGQFMFLLSFGLFVVVTTNFYFRILCLKIKLKDQIKNITKKEWISFLLICFFIQSITPFSLGSEPYSIWWLRKKGVKINQALISVSLNSVAGFISQFIVTWPSFIYFTIHNFSKIQNNTITYIYGLVLMGLFIDLVVGLFIFGISYSSYFHYCVATIYHKFLFYFKANRLFSKNFLKSKYLFQEIFKKQYVKSLIQWGTIKVIAIHCLHIIFVYIFFVGCYAFVFSSGHNFTAYFNVFNVINIGTTANNFIPIPGGEGTVQYTILELLKSSSVASSSAAVSSSVLSSNIMVVNVQGVAVAENFTQKISMVIFFGRSINHYLSLIISQIFVFYQGIKYMFHKPNYLT